MKISISNPATFEMYHGQIALYGYKIGFTFAN